MMSFPTPSVYQSSKCSCIHGVLNHPEPKQLPSKGKPWASLLAQDFVHKVDLILPQEAADKLRMKLAQESYSPTYHRVIMKLADILDGEFFTQYIKVGSIIMLSQGDTSQDNVFSLKDGQLTMFLDKEAYERAGLVGKPHGVKGKRGLKPRWIVQYNLREPASFPGKKGYDRLLFQAPDPDPLLNFFPTKYTSAPSVEEDLTIQTPTLKIPEHALLDDGRLEREEFAADIYEWLSLLRLQSPRVETGDQIDPFLSRYSVPSASGEVESTKLCKISWQGFIAPGWARQVLVDTILSVSSRSWFSLSATSFGKGVKGESSDWTILRLPGALGEYLLWDIHGHE
ncbi:hypothetical protein G7054_g3237 [Neopestalotiopsis clavispora]|nr:hypothetical protein G7054_g3237 [Neopestalotiopsis clavispora]